MTGPADHDDVEDDPTYRLPPPGWDPDDHWEPSNNDALNYKPVVDEHGVPGQDDFYEP